MYRKISTEKGYGWDICIIFERKKLYHGILKTILLSDHTFHPQKMWDYISLTILTSHSPSKKGREITNNTGKFHTFVSLD